MAASSSEHWYFFPTCDRVSRNVGGIYPKHSYVAHGQLLVVNQTCRQPWGRSQMVSDFEHTAVSMDFRRKFMSVLNAWICLKADMLLQERLIVLSVYTVDDYRNPACRWETDQRLNLRKLCAPTLDTYDARNGRDPGGGSKLCQIWR